MLMGEKNRREHKRGECVRETEMEMEGMRKKRFKDFLHFFKSLNIDSYGKFFKIRPFITHQSWTSRNSSLCPCLEDILYLNKMQDTRYGRVYLISFNPYKRENEQYDEKLAKM